MKIFISVTGQTMYATNSYRPIVNGTQNFIQFRFGLDKDWKSLTSLVAQFTQDNKSYNLLLDDEYTCMLPSEIQTGRFTILLFGNGTDGVRATSNVLTFRVDDSALVEDASSTKITPTLYDQLMAKFDTISLVTNDTINSLRATDVSLSKSLATKAEQDALAEEITRATRAESDLASQITAKADKTTVAELELEVDSVRQDVAVLGYNVSEFVNNEDVQASIESAVTETLADYLEQDKFAALTIGDGTIEEAKLSEELVEKINTVYQTSYVCEELPIIGDELCDYYLLNDGVYEHYRWIDGKYHQVGTNTYTKDEIDLMVSKVQTQVSNQNLRVTELEENAVTQLNVVGDEIAVTYMNGMQDFYRIESGTNLSEWYIDDANCLHLLDKDGVDVLDPLKLPEGGGGGGGTSNDAVFSCINMSGFTTKTISEDGEADITLNFSSTEADGTPTGNGTAKITVNGIAKTTYNLVQGTNVISLKKYLSTGSNTVVLSISDIYGNSKTMRFSFTVISFSLASNFDSSATYSDAISYTYTPTGAFSKTVYFYLDGSLLGTQTVTTSGRQQTYIIPKQDHGSHELEVYFTAEVDGQIIESNHLYYDLICLIAGDVNKIISIDWNETQVDQYSTNLIHYKVYDPQSLTADISLLVNNKVQTTLTVDRTDQVWSIRFDEAGEVTIGIMCGDTVKSKTVTVSPKEIDMEAETSDLELYLSSYGRSNSESNPAVWKYNDIECVFTNFNWNSDGWQIADDGSTVMRTLGDGRVFIPFNIFGSDFKATGKTIEFDFATHDVRDYSTEIISCMDGGRGISITAEEAKLTSSQSTISQKYKDDEHFRISFVVEKRAEYKMIYLYIDGVISRAIQYADNDNFQQNNPTGITIGSNDCTTDIYTIRVYNNDLTRYQMLANWICDTQDGSLMLERYSRNNIFDDYGNIVIDKLPSDLPYLVLEGTLPTFKGDKQTIKGSFTDPENPSRCFTFENCQIGVQGTSSAGYTRKNYKMKFKGGFDLPSGHSDTYPLRVGAIPTSTFTMKADVASSEGANNVELVRLYNEVCPYRTPPQLENDAIRQGIDGFPIVIFHNDGENTTFLGRANMNNDKGTPEVYGFGDGDESWETLNNTSLRCLFQSWDDSTDWTSDYERRHPDDDTDPDPSDLRSLIKIVSGWDLNTVTKADVESIFEIKSALFYFLFAEQFTMVDSMAKNSFPTKFAGGKWCWLPYDFDTGLGINNEGQLTFSYNLEFGDQDEGADVFNGTDHKFWQVIQKLYQDELSTMYSELRSSGDFSYDKVDTMFTEHQSKWPEAIVNEDTLFKYLEPLYTLSDGTYLTMVQGLKTAQRKWWLKHKFEFTDSKYKTSDNTANIITLRGYAKADLTITTYADMYINVKYGSYMVTEPKASKNVPYVMACPLDNVNDTEIYVYGSNCVSKVEGMPALQVGYANFTQAEKLVEIVLGSSEAGYTNQRLTELYLGDLKLLQKIDCTNCVALGTGTMAVVDASGCTNIEEIYMDNTSITGIGLPNGGQLRKLHLPATLTNLTIRNQQKLEEVYIADKSNISLLWLENVNDIIDPIALLDEIDPNARIRLIGLDFGQVTVDEMHEFYDRLDEFAGVDENGYNTDTAQVSGTCYIPVIDGTDYTALLERYPYITITYDTLTSRVLYYNYDGSTLVYTETVQTGKNAAWTGSISRLDTAQYKYTFDGWSSAPNGTLWANAQKNVTGERKLYAHYTATIRTYNVNFYNGSTLIYTDEDVPYGGTGVYPYDVTELVDPSGSGAVFQFWSPSPVAITGTTNCYAQYINETISEDWATIDSYCKAGTILDHYNIGDTKIYDFGGTCGPVAMMLTAVDTDNKSDGTGTANTTWTSVQVSQTSVPWTSTELVVIRTYYNGWIVNSDGGWKSNSNGLHSIKMNATFTLSPTETGTITMDYKVSSEKSYDKLNITIDGTKVVENLSGDNDWMTYDIEATAGTDITVEVQYSKDSSVSYGDDTAYINFEGIDSSNIVFETGQYSETIGYQEGTGAVGGYKDSALRTTIDGLYEAMDTDMKARIIQVSKYTSGIDSDRVTHSGNTAWYVDLYLWPLSYEELDSSQSNYDNVTYPDAYPDADSRCKKKVGGTNYSNYWTRTASGGNHGSIVLSTGSLNYSTSADCPYAIGFCL